MKEKWSDAAWRAAEQIYEEILRHPFVKELASGELDREKFLFLSLIHISEPTRPY